MLTFIGFLKENKVEGDVEHKSSANGIHYDQKNGLGNVPNNQEVNYRGFSVMMKPSQFHRLTPKREYPSESGLNHIKEHLKQNKPIGSPHLYVAKDVNGHNRVIDHEGRTRMQAIHEVHGDKPVLVHIFHRNKAHNLTQEHVEHMRNNLGGQVVNSEKLPRPFKGPHFTNYHLHNKWHE